MKAICLSLCVACAVLAQTADVHAFGIRGGAPMHMGPAMNFGHATGFNGGGGFGPHPGPGPGPGPRPPGPPGPGPGPNPPGPRPDPHPYHPGWYYPGAAAAVATAVAIGSIIDTLPEDCVESVVNGIIYQHCSEGWYRPEYDGPDVQYVAVDAP